MRCGNCGKGIRHPGSDYCYWCLKDLDPVFAAENPSAEVPPPVDLGEPVIVAEEQRVVEVKVKRKKRKKGTA